MLIFNLNQTFDKYILSKLAYCFNQIEEDQLQQVLDISIIKLLFKIGDLKYKHLEAVTRH